MPTAVHRSAALTLLLCAAGSILVGLAVFGERIFDRHLQLFQFVAVGLVGGVYAAAFRHYGTRAGLLALPLVCVALALSTGSTTAALVLRDVLGGIGWCIAVRVGLAGSTAFPRVLVGTFVLWAAVFGMTHLGLFALLSLIHSTPIDSYGAMMVTKLGLLIGAGIGLGYEVSELVAKRAAS